MPGAWVAHYMEDSSMTKNPQPGQVCRSGIHLHQAPDMTPEPTANQIRHWLEMRGTRLTVHAVVKAREALRAEWREELGPPVTCPAVFLPDNGLWLTGWPVEIRLLDPDTEAGE